MYTEQDFEKGMEKLADVCYEHKADMLKVGSILIAERDKIAFQAWKSPSGKLSPVTPEQSKTIKGFANRGGGEPGPSQAWDTPEYQGMKKNVEDSAQKHQKLLDDYHAYYKEHGGTYLRGSKTASVRKIAAAGEEAMPQPGFMTKHPVATTAMGGAAGAVGGGLLGGAGGAAIGAMGGPANSTAMGASAGATLGAIIGAALGARTAENQEEDYSQQLLNYLSKASALEKLGMGPGGGPSFLHQMTSPYVKGIQGKGFFKEVHKNNLGQAEANQRAAQSKVDLDTAAEGAKEASEKEKKETTEDVAGRYGRGIGKMMGKGLNATTLAARALTYPARKIMLPKEMKELRGWGGGAKESGGNIGESAGRGLVRGIRNLSAKSE